MNRRQTTKGLNVDQVKEIAGAWHQARRIGQPLNALISFRPYDPDETMTFDDHHRLCARFRNKLGCYMRSKGFDLTYVWTRESNPDGTGEHLHVLIHVPERHWSHFQDTVIGWHPGPGEIDIEPANQRTLITYFGKRYSAVGYILKQMTPQAWFRRGLTRKKGGPIVGKRGGTSRNIGWRAQCLDRAPPVRDRLTTTPHCGGAAPRAVSEI